jgi:sarcosine oxidase
VTNIRHFNAIVVGLGAMGSATLYHLARRGWKVLGLEQFAPGHDRGSSHGDSRIIRETYFEHPLYVPLVRRAHRLWRDLEQRSGSSLMTITGGIMIGPPHGAVVPGTLRSAASILKRAIVRTSRWRGTPAPRRASTRACSTGFRTAAAFG